MGGWGDYKTKRQEQTKRKEVRAKTQDTRGNTQEEAKEARTRKKLGGSNF